MAIVEITHFGGGQLHDEKASKKTIDETIQKALGALEGVATPTNFVIGTQIQDKNAVQITSESNSVRDYANLEANPEHSAFISCLRSHFGEPQNTFHVAFNRSAFGTGGPATGNVIEFVQNYFPASRVTPEFQKQVEGDLLKFDEIYKEGARGDVGLAFGWALEEQEHENIVREKAKCFIVARGWESMEYFEKSVQNEAFGKAIPILLAWNTPYKMWHVERKT